MEEIVFFNNAKESVTAFFDREFPNFPPLLMSHFLNKFNDFLNYTEEGQSIKPKIVFTNNIYAIERAIPKSFIFPIFEDTDPTMFNSRLKSILAIARQDCCLYVEVKDDKFSYGLCMSLSSIKDVNLLQSLEENEILREKSNKVHCIIARPLNFYTMQLHSISGNELVVNFSLDKSKNSNFNQEIKEFVDATFSKLRTTNKKLQDIKNMYLNIFTNVMSDVNGAICVIVDKDYKESGLFEDGIWLKEPISFSKLFSQSKSYSEEKLQAFADLFISMLNFDGITIIDNTGKICAYNVFVETNAKRVGYIVGGARKRAAYTVLNSKKKDIIGVYFQSHEGEVFFQELKKSERKKTSSKPKQISENKTNIEAKQNTENKQILEINQASEIKQELDTITTKVNKPADNE